MFGCFCFPVGLSFFQLRHTTHSSTDVFRCLPIARNTPPNSHCDSGHDDKTQLPAVFYEQRTGSRAATSCLRSSCLLCFCPLCKISSAGTVSVTHSPGESDIITQKNAWMYTNAQGVHKHHWNKQPARGT